ncbi:hypothetical protein Dip518_000083 [Parelusimicrobium proximum]|uniref:M50 family metallopeptidase n=1 Tax=Parelusimicrobium proximum TaxID=3228953 RepID=UPI003D16F9B9
MREKIIKIIIAVFLLPAVYFTVKECAVASARITLDVRIAAVFIAGGVFYILQHFFMYNFSRFYVAAHEFTHALAAMFFGFKVHSVKIKKNSGHVKLSDYNTAVLLAPYILPLYFVICAIICFILYKNGLNTALYKNTYAFVLGFLWFMHIIHTVKTISETEQPDLKMAGGAIFSVIIILFANVLILLVFLGILFPEYLPVWSILKNIVSDTVIVWKKVLNYILESIIKILKL